MDHIVYVDAKENDLERLFSGDFPGGALVINRAHRVIQLGTIRAVEQVGPDVLHVVFTRNNGEGMVRACASVLEVQNLGPLSEELANKILDQYQKQLNLTPAQQKRWRGKRFLVLIHIGTVQALDAFPFDRSGYGNMDDWLPVGNIQAVKG